MLVLNAGEQFVGRLLFGHKSGVYIYIYIRITVIRDESIKTTSCAKRVIVVPVYRVVEIPRNILH